MVTKEHEAPIELFRKNPNLLPIVLRQLGIDVDVPNSATLEFVAGHPSRDASPDVFALEVPLLKADGVPVLAVIYDVPRDPVETGFSTWVLNMVAVWERYGVPVVLLVYCEEVAQARKLAEPISLGPAGFITAHAISPQNLPPITNINDYVGRVELAVLAALMHSGDPDYEKTLENLSALLATIDQEKAQKHAEDLVGLLGEPAATRLAELTGIYERQDGFARFEARGRAEGKAEGEAKMLVRMLEMRGFDVTPQVRGRVLACRDTAQLEAWADRIPQADTIEKVFD